MPGHIQSIERAAAILRLLSGRSLRLGVAELAGELGLPKGTVFGILKTLREVGFVEQDRDSGKYQLGPALLHMGSSYLDGNELRTRALNWADALATRSGESVRIGTLHEHQVLIVHHVFRPDDTRQALEVGSLLPTHATALGKALLANHDYVAGDARQWRAGELHTRPPSPTSRGCAESSRRPPSAAGPATSASCSRASPRSRRRSRIAGGDGRRDRDRGPDRAAVRQQPPRAEFVDYVMEAARAVSRELGAIPW